MTHRDRIFDALTGVNQGITPFAPDITDWYQANRLPQGAPRRFEPGQLIPDGDPLHSLAGSIPPEYREYSLLDFHRAFGWGCFFHVYDWYETVYEDSVTRLVTIEGDTRTTTYVTTSGNLTARDRLALDGTWTPVEHFAKTVDDLAIMAKVIEAERFIPRYERVSAVLDEIGGQGAADTVIFYSPFGRLVHEIMGFEQVVYALADAPDAVHDFLTLLDNRLMELVRLAARTPGRLVIISDHPDEYLIAPPYYSRYCIPFYNRAAEILHRAGKLVSNHLDGNCRGFFPYFPTLGIDYLDGCTPAPMFNYEPEELAAALTIRMSAFCGVPAALFCRPGTEGDILSIADHILYPLAGRGVLNVGDILPPDGDIKKVIMLGHHATGAHT